MGTKSKRNPLRILSFLLLMVALLIPTTLATGDKTGNTSLEGSDTSAGTLGGIVGGWNDLRSGYRLYVVNQSNTSKSPVLDIWFTKDLFIADNPENHKKYLFTRAGSALASDWDDVVASNLLEGDMPKPWTNGASNWSSLDAWLLEVRDGYDINNAERAIEQVFGKGVLDEFRANAGEDPYYLVIEPLANFGVYAPEGSYSSPIYTRMSFQGTFYNWCTYLDNILHWDLGGPPIDTRTNKTFAYAIHLQDYDWTDDSAFDLVCPSVTDGFISASMGKAEGYGIAMYKISDLTMNGRIQTYDEALGSTPGPAPEPETEGQKGIFTIVKVYATQMSEDPQDLQYDGCYTRLQVCKNIDILDEPDYTVREWHTSKTTVKTPILFIL